MATGDALHHDPTYEAACRMEVDEKGCAVCVRRLELSAGGIHCSTGKRFPFCKGNKNGFLLGMGGNNDLV